MEQDQIRRAAQDLLDALAIAIPKVESAIVMQTNRGWPYDGPNIRPQMDALKAALCSTPCRCDCGHKAGKVEAPREDVVERMCEATRNAWEKRTGKEWKHKDNDALAKDMTAALAVANEVALEPLTMDELREDSFTMKYQSPINALLEKRRARLTLPPEQATDQSRMVNHE